jgi:hypothetical protein
MLLRLMPEAVSRQWDFIMPQVRRSMPPDEQSDSTMNGILRGILRNQIQCWISYDTENNNEVNAILLLTIIEDPFKDEKNMLLYAITRVTGIDKATTLRMYQEGIQAIMKVMKKGGYSKLVGFIDKENNYLVKTAEELGAKLRWHWAVDRMEV